MYFITTFYFGKAKDSPCLFLSSAHPLPSFSNDDTVLYWITTSLLALDAVPPLSVPFLISVTQAT